LEDGDIVNVDVTVYYKGVHGKNLVSLVIIIIYAVMMCCICYNLKIVFMYKGDLNETYFVGNVDESSLHLVRSTYECLEKAISIGNHSNFNDFISLNRYIRQAFILSSFFTT
jgi:methionyl aminopeptidase